METERGRVKVGEDYKTNVPHIYAIGDVTGGIQLAHAAEAQGIACVEGICGLAPTVDANLVPSCVYTSPEIATIGITADEAKAQGRAVITGKYVMSGNGKSIIENEDRGFIKLVFDAETKKTHRRAADVRPRYRYDWRNGYGCKRRTDQSAAGNGAAPAPNLLRSITEAVHAADGHSIHTMPPRRR